MRELEKLDAVERLQLIDRDGRIRGLQRPLIEQGLNGAAVGGLEIVDESKLRLDGPACRRDDRLQQPILQRSRVGSREVVGLAPFRLGRARLSGQVPDPARLLPAGSIRDRENDVDIAGGVAVAQRNASEVAGRTTSPDFPSA